MQPVKTILIAGAGGFLGQVLVNYFRTTGRQVTVLTRRPAEIYPPGVRYVRWDGRRGGDWEAALEGVDAVINLAGRTVNCRYTPANRREILESRLRPTTLLGQAMARCARPPAVWLNAASATIYRHAEDRAMDEVTGDLGAGFSVEVCRRWEEALRRHCPAETRGVCLRTSMVLGLGTNSVYPVLVRLVRWGLGGAMGHGRQFVSWLHYRDFCRAVDYVLVRPELRGAVNLTAPEPVTNGYLMECLRETLGRPIGLPATRTMLEVGAWLLRTETELILKSRRVVPHRLLEAGFQYDYPTLPEALAALQRETERRVIHSHQGGRRTATLRVFCTPLGEL